MYQYNITQGTVIRLSDNKQVAPCQSVDDLDYIEYQNWVANGNEPTIVSDPVIEPNIIPAFDFRDRFTQTELATLLAHAYGGDTISQLLLLKVQTANAGIDLNSQSVKDGVGYLAMVGVITADRIPVVLG